MTMTRTEIDRIEFTEQETLASGGSVAISASVVGSRISIVEHWSHHDEIYSDGVQVDMPVRVWRELSAAIDHVLGEKK